MSCLFSKQIWVVPSLNPSKVFSDPPPPFGFSVTTDPQGINNDRSLMRFAVIMQHATIAYHVQRAYKGPTIWLLKGEEGGDGGGIGDFRKKYSEVWFWAQKSLARKYLPYNSFVYCQGKTFYHQRFGGKNSYANPWNHPYPNDRPLITCRKSCYRLILRLRDQSLIVHYRSKLIHVYSLLHDEHNTVGRLGTF